MRTSPDFLSFLQQLAREPWSYDFYQALRRTECLNPDKPRIGRALRPSDEPVRLGQEPSVAFAQSTLARAVPAGGERAPRLEVRFFGLLGPNGPMPLHITEYARSRLLHANDPTLARFLDVLQHRYLEMFYRAWADAQPTVSLDRPRQDRFGIWLGSLGGLGTPQVRQRDAFPDFAKLHFIGLLNRQIRNAEGLGKMLSGFFRVPVTVEQFVGHWMPVPTSERSRLGGAFSRLGRDIVVGSRVWDRQHKFRLRIGALSLAQYESFLPGDGCLAQLAAAVRNYFGLEFAWDAQLLLAADEVPQTRLGGSGRLGYTTWLGSRTSDRDADDLVLDVDRVSGLPGTEPLAA